MPQRTDIKNILLIGSGPIVIGQACEFDYSGTQAAKTLKNLGYRVVLINSNPATIMTDPDFAHRTYIEPITKEVITNIIAQEKIDAILPTMGGQTALNVAMEMYESGALEGVKFLGANPAAIKKGEDRQAFKEAMLKIGMDLPKSHYAYNEEEAEQAAQNIGFPLIIRASYTLAGGGSGVAYNIEEFKALAKAGLEASPINEILIEESLLGWKEFEMEVIRDKNDNCIIVCSIENLDPMGVHTGDSITIAPALTLTDKEYQRMRDASFKILREIGVDTGGSNVQFAINPKNGRMTVIEMNPRVSRSSALASKATGYPIAKVATMLAVGFSLDEISNDITGTPASFEPSIDYIVTKIPRFAFEKFPLADSTLTTSMKSIGEVMAIGGCFKESVQKALCSLENGLCGFDSITSDIEVAKRETRRPNANRILYVADCFRLGLSIDEVADLSHIDKWFLSQIYELVREEGRVKSEILRDSQAMRNLKSQGFSDKMLARLLAQNEGVEVSEGEIYMARKEMGVVARYEEVDTCAAEFPSLTSYLYSTIPCNPLSAGNSSLGLHSADFANLGHCADSSLALRPKFAKNHESQTENPSVVDSARNAQNLNQNNSVRSTQTRPLRGAKNREQGCSSATADFLLEADKRGSPPKSEKRQLLGTHFKKVGGSGAGGAALLRKESSENCDEGGAESGKDSIDSQNLQGGLQCRFAESARNDENLSQKDNAQKVLIIGGGPNRIGQGIEFDYCCVHSSFALKDLGIQSIMYNCNPETVSTDYDTSDTLYFEPIDFERVRAVVEREKPDGIIVHFGGQTPLKLSHALQKIDAKIIGTSVKAIDIAEDREKFANFARELGLNQPQNGIAYKKDEAFDIANAIGYPVLVRPSYVLGGRAMRIVQSDEELRLYMDEAVKVSEDSPVLIDKFLENAIELDVDAICDGEEVYIGGIMQHIEEAGIHSGDSASCLPPFSLSDEIICEIETLSAKIALKLGVLGLLNIQFAIYAGKIYIIEVNPRASRTVPFVSKATGIPLAKIATRVMWNCALNTGNSGNSPLDLHSADFANLRRFADFSPVSHPKFAKNHESQTENPSVVDSARGAQNLGENSKKIAESSTFCNATIFCHSERSEESQKNIQNRDSSVASLSQNDKNKDFAESSLDSANSAPSTHEANSTIADEFLGFCEASNKDKTKVYRGSEPKRALRKQLAHTCKSIKSRCESEFAKGILREALQFYDNFNRVDFSAFPLKPKAQSYIAIKESVFPFSKLSGADVILGPEMKSTGEVMGIDKNFGISFAKSQIACKNTLPLGGSVLLSVANNDKAKLPKIAKGFLSLGFKILATGGTFEYLERYNIPAQKVLKISEGRPNIHDLLTNGEICLIVNTSDNKSSKDDARKIRAQVVRLNLPYFTTLAGASIALRAIGEVQGESPNKARALQDYLGIVKSSVGNSSLDLHSADLADLGRLAQTSSLALRPKSAKNHESQTENPSVVDSANLSNSQNLNKNNSVRSTQTRPLRGAKNRIQASSSATADFLLEAEKRGSPPKSEKRQLLGTHFKKVGGSGAGGAALLRKENSNENAESIRDSSPTAQNDNLSDFAESSLDSAIRTKKSKKDK